VNLQTRGQRDADIRVVERRWPHARFSDESPAALISLSARFRPKSIRPLRSARTTEFNGKDAPSVRMRHRHRPPTGPDERFLRKRSSESGRQLAPLACGIAHQRALVGDALLAISAFRRGSSDDRFHDRPTEPAQPLWRRRRPCWTTGPELSYRPDALVRGPRIFERSSRFHEPPVVLRADPRQSWLLLCPSPAGSRSHSPTTPLATKRQCRGPVSEAGLHSTGRGIGAWFLTRRRSGRGSRGIAGQCGRVGRRWS
jgi:hypothetical protein